MRSLVIVSQSRSGGTARLVDALVAGASDPDAGAVEVRRYDALSAGIDEVRRADLVVLATPEHFGTVSGAAKHFLEGVYDPARAEALLRPYALVVKAGNDGSGTVRDVTRIMTGLGWREVLAPLVVVGDIGDVHLGAAREFGMTLAAGLDAGLF